MYFQLQYMKIFVALQKISNVATKLAQFSSEEDKSLKFFYRELLTFGS